MSTKAWIWTVAAALFASVVVGHSLWIRSVTSGVPAALVSPDTESTPPTGAVDPGTFLLFFSGAAQ